MGETPTTVWIDIRTTQRVVELGLRAMLERAQAPFEFVTEGPPDAQPDLVLYDVINLNDRPGDDLDVLVERSVSTVIAVDRTLKPELGVRAREKGVEWAITLGITEEELIQVIYDALAGTLDSEDNVAEVWDALGYIGREDGLSPRESSVLQLVVMGRSNQEIAQELYLSINSVKTYIRSTYRKIGATSRSQAILWAVRQGFLTERYDPAS